MTGASLVGFLLRRVALASAFLLITSFGVFSLVHLAPGDPVRTLLGTRPSNPEMLATLREQYHLDKPFIVQYCQWLSRILRADLGRSISGDRSVLSLVGERVGVTVLLGLISMFVVLVAGILLGVAAAVRRGTTLDRVAVMFGVLGISSPAFVTSVILLYVFGVVLGLFPTFGSGDGLVGRLWHLALPSTALVMSVMGIIVKVTRIAVIAELDKDYVRFARACGLGPARIVLIYVLRNALIPVITAAGIVVVGLLANAVYVEVTFALPGLGSLLVDAVGRRDLPVIQGTTLVFACFVVVLHLLVDVAYALIDPRIRLAKVTS